MASRRSSIGARLELDKSPFSRALDSVKSAVRAWKANMESMKISKGALTGEGLAVGKWTELSSKMNVAGVALNALGSAAGFVGDKLKEAAEVEMNFETALAGLAAASDGTETLAEQVAQLMALGQKPGLGFQEVVKGSRNLQAIGLSAKESRDAMEQFGNAIAKSGGTKTEFDNVSDALKKIGGSATVTMDQVDRIADVIPEFLKLTRNLDKSDPQAWVRGSVEALKTLPRATVTAREALSNLEDSYNKTIIEKSDGRMVALVKKMSAAAEAGLEGDMAGIVQEMSMALAAGLDGDNLVAKFELPPEVMEARRKARQQEIEDGKKLAQLAKEKAEYAQQQAREDQRLEKLAAGQKTRLESERELRLLEAKKQGIASVVEELERAYELEDMIQELEEAGMSPEDARQRAQAIADVKARIAQQEAEKETKLAADQAKAEQAAKDSAKQDAEKASSDSIAVMRLRAAGKNKQADKLEQEQERDAREKQLVDAGMEPWLASSRASEEMFLKRRMAEGRRVTYGGNDGGGAKGLSEVSYGGLDAYKDMQKSNVLAEQARKRKEAEAQKKEAAADAKAAKAIENWGTKMVSNLEEVNSKLEAIHSKPTGKL